MVKSIILAALGGYCLAFVIWMLAQFIFNVADFYKVFSILVILTIVGCGGLPIQQDSVLLLPNTEIHSYKAGFAGGNSELHKNLADQYLIMGD